MTVDEILSRIGEVLTADWMGKVKWTRDTFEGFKSHGCPADYARTLSDLFGIPLETWPRLIHPPKALHNSEVKSRVKSDMHAQHRLAISEGRATRDKKFKAKIRGAKFTQAKLAGAVGMKESLLSMCRSGERAMFLSRAKRVEELTGWPADKAHWPGGLIEDA